MRLVLASASPRRAELLRAAGYEFDIIAVDIDESRRDSESPSTYVRRLAAEKSAAYAVSGISLSADRRDPKAGRRDPKAGRRDPKTDRRDPKRVALQHAPALQDTTVARPFQGRDDVVILAADTTVVVGDAILGKPRDDEEVASMLRCLSGRRHEVVTGISLRRGAFEAGRVETTAVHFAPLSEEDVAWYVASGEGRDKAGAYAIQGRAARFIRRIEGSYSNVVGLPLATVHELLVQILASPIADGLS
jgi:septum formation protein